MDFKSNNWLDGTTNDAMGENKSVTEPAHDSMTTEKSDP
jgi:hypothetical protein